MSIKEVVQALGNWGVTLKSSTPREVIREIEQNKFGHIAILPGRINPAEYGDGLLRAARYVGVYRSTFKQSDDTIQIKGVGMNFWLGDEDNKGDIFETPIVLNEVTFPNAIRALLPRTGAVKEGTLYSIPGAGTYKHTHQWETPRKAIEYVCGIYTTSAAFTGTDRIVEYRVNGDSTIDAGRIEDLYRMTPQAILVRKDTGRDMRLLGLQADMSMDYDVEDLTTRVVLLAEGEGATLSTGSADAPPTGFVDLFGNPIKMTRVVSESNTTTGDAETRAQFALTRWTLPRQAIQLRTADFDIKGDIECGDYIYVFDPEAGFYDLDNEVYWRGQPINPLALRVKEMDWQIRAGWTVAFRKADGTWIDLSEHYRPESGGSTLAVGDYRRTLAGNNYEPISFRPNLPNEGADNTIPAAPVFTGFSSGVYEADDRTLSAVQIDWDQPLNVDGSTITDGDHYEIRYRPNAIIGTSVPLDLLSGGYDVDFTETFPNALTGSWGPDWTGFTSASRLETVVGEGHIIHPTFNVLRGLNYNGTFTDVEVYRSTSISYQPAGAATVMGVLLRSNVIADFYHAAAWINPDLTVGCRIAKMSGSAWFGNMADHGVIPGLTYTPGSGRLWIKATAIGNALSMKVWLGTIEDEPVRDNINVMDGAPIASGTVGVLDWIDSGATNPPDIITRTHLYQVRSLVADNPGSAYSWDDLGSWDAPTSEPVAVTPNWSTAFVPWDSTITTLLDLSPGAQYEFQIRAVDSAKPPNFGPWSASTFINTTGDVIAPSTPAAPEVAASMIAIQVIHTLGKASGGIFNLEQDVNLMEVHASHIPDFLPTDETKVGEISLTGAMIRGQIPAVGSFKVDQTEDIWVRVVVVDRAGNRSAASEAAQSTIVLIDDAHISDLTVSKVTAGTITAQWLLVGSIKTAETGARVELTGQGLKAYNNAGQQTVSISSSTGAATFTGVLQTAIDEAGIMFTINNNLALGYWSVNDNSTGDPLDHRVKQIAYDSGSLWGQLFEESVRTRVGDLQDGSKLILSEDATILSHQPQARGKPEAYLALGAWPQNFGNDFGFVYGQGKFNDSYLADGAGLFFIKRDTVAAGFGAASFGYGPTTSEFMNINVTLHSAGTVSHWLTAETFVGFTIGYSDGAAHVFYIQVMRQDAV